MDSQQIFTWMDELKSQSETGEQITSEPKRERGIYRELLRQTGEVNGNPFQYSCLENPMGEAW